MAAGIGGISADFGLATARFNRDIADATRRLETGGSRMNRTLGTMQARWDRFGNGLRRATRNLVSWRGAMGLAAGLTGLGYLINRSIDAADNIGKTADAIGLTTDELQELRFQAGEAGVGMQQFDTAVRTAVNNIGLFRQGSGTLYTMLGDDTAFRETIGNTNSLGDALEVLADRYVATADEIERRSLAAAIFGTRGIAMSNVLRNGAEGMREYTAEAHRLGLVLDEDVVRNAEAARDAIDRLVGIVRVQFTNALATAAPQITEFATRIVENLPRIITQFERLGEVLGLFDKPIGERLANSLSSIEFTAFNGETVDGALDRARSQLRGIEEQLSHLPTPSWLSIDPNAGLAIALAHRATELRAAITEIETIMSSRSIDVFSGTLLPPAEEAERGGRTTGERWWSGFAEALAQGGGGGAQASVFLRLAEGQVAALQARLDAKGSLFTAQGGIMSLGEESISIWDRAAERMKEFGAAAGDLGDQISNGLGGALKSLEHQLVETFLTGKFSARDFANEILRLAAEIAVRQAVINPLSGFISTGLQSLGSLFTPSTTAAASGPWWSAGIGHNASGTPNWRGGPTWVGERGPEIIDAPRGSRIYDAPTSARMTQGGGGVSVQIINNTGAPVQQRRQRGPDGREILQVTVGDMISNGGFDKSMKGRYGSSPRPIAR